MLGDWHLPDGAPLPLCPRGALRRALGRIAERGLELRAAVELECYLVPAEGTLHERAYPYHGLRTAPTASWWMRSPRRSRAPACASRRPTSRTGSGSSS